MISLPHTARPAVYAMGFAWEVYSASTPAGSRVAHNDKSYHAAHFHVVHPDAERILNNGTTLDSEPVKSDMECANRCMMRNKCVFFLRFCYQSTQCRQMSCRLVAPLTV